MTSRRPRATAPPDSAEKGLSEAGAAGTVQMRAEKLALSPVYRHLRDSITRPHLRLTESRYFWERWKPRLGPDASVLIMEVRDRCNRSLALADGSDVGGGDCTVGANELAAACGFSRVTLWRILQREDVRRFVWVEHNYVYDQSMGKKRRTISTYHVLMEDPLVEEDEAYVQSLMPVADSPSVQSETLVPTSTVPVAAPVIRPRLQTETKISGPIVQSATTPVPFTLKPENVQETNLNKRLGATERRPITAIGDVVKQGSLSDPRAFLAALLSRDAAATIPSTSTDTGIRSVPESQTGEEGVVRVPLRAPDSGQRREGRRPTAEKYPEFVPFVEQAERLLGDRHSRGFYVTALRSLHPDHMHVWHRALGLAAEQPPETIRRSRGALFTSLLRSFATAAGVTIGPSRASTS